MKATDEPIELSAFELLFKELGVEAALTGTRAAGDATLRFSAMTDVTAMIEIMPARTGRGGLRTDDVWQGALPGGSDHGGIDSTSQQIAVSEVAWISSVKTKI